MYKSTWFFHIPKFEFSSLLCFGESTSNEVTIVSHPSKFTGFRSFMSLKFVYNGILSGIDNSIIFIFPGGSN